MTSPVECFLRCRVVEVLAQLGPDEALSPLERLFLRAVGAGQTHFSELKALFHIGNRPTLDLVFDLWHRGHLALDLREGRVHLTERAAAAVKDHQEGKLAPGEVNDIPIPILLEELTGAVLPVAGTVLRAPAELTIPNRTVTRSLKEATPEKLLRTLRREIREGRYAATDERRRLLERPRRVLGARLTFDQLQRTEEHRFLPLTLRVEEDEDNEGMLHVSVLEPERLPDDVRRSLEEEIAQLAAELPEAIFFKQLRSSIGRGRSTRRPPDVVLDQLHDRVMALQHIAPPMAPDRHAELLRLAQEADEVLDTECRAAVNLRVITGQQEHRDALAEMIGAANKQIVIAGPWMSEEGLKPIAELLRNAMQERGCQVFLLWGMAANEVADRGAENLLVNLSSGYPHLFFRSSRSSVSHAKIAVCDARDALVSSSNFMRPSAEKTLEVGLRLQAVSPEAPCQPILMLLEWARKALPDERLARRVCSTHEEFIRQLPTERPVPLVRPATPTKWTEAMDPELEVPALRSWEESWRGYLQGLRLRRAQWPLQAAVVTNEQHRTQLWDALRTPFLSRLVLASDQLGPEVVNEAFLATLTKRLEEGTQVALIWRRLVKHATTGPGAASVTTLRDLAARYSNQLHLLENSESHAKVLVADDKLIVGSFNFLSFDGYYGDDATARRKPLRKELGLSVRHAGLCQAVLEQIAGWLPDRFPAVLRAPLPLRHTPEPLSSVRAPVSQLVAELALVPPSERAARLRAEFTKRADRWELLDSLQCVGLPDDQLAIAAAVALAGETASTAPERLPWLTWLNRRAWEGGRWTEALVLREALDQDEVPSLPRRPLVLMAATSGTELAATCLYDAGFRTDLRTAERTTIAAMALLERTRPFNPSSADTVLQRHRETLPDAWEKLARQLDTFWADTFSPLPWSEILRGVEAVEARQAQERRWLDLAQTVRRVSSYSYKFASGNETQRYLFETGAFRGLQAAADQRDTGMLGTILANPALLDLGAALDFATRQVMPAEWVFEEPLRGRVLARFAAMLTEARGVLDHGLPSGTRGEERQLLRARQLTPRLRELWPALTDATERLGAPENVLLSRVQRELEPISRWE